MRIIASLAGGLAGALSVTLLQEWLRRIDPSAPRLDLLRKQAAVRISEKLGIWSPKAEKVDRYSRVGDILGNTLYYSMAAAGRKRVLTTGILLGTGMTGGVLALPRTLGLNRAYASGSAKRRWMTAGMFIMGELVSAYVSRFLSRQYA